MNKMKKIIFLLCISVFISCAEQSKHDPKQEPENISKTVQEVRFLIKANCFVLTTTAWHDEVIVTMLVAYSGERYSHYCCNVYTYPILNDSVKRLQFNIAEKRRLEWIENIKPLSP